MNTILKMMLIGAALCWNTALFAQTGNETEEPQLQQLEEIQLIAVYPNPATERLLIEFNANELGEELLLRIKNDDGKLVFKRSLITSKGGNMVILPVIDFPTGEYVVWLDEGRKVKKATWQKM